MKVLVVVDMQKDFVNGSLGSPEAQAIVPNVKKKVEEAVKNGDMIIYTRDTHFADYLNTKEGQKLPVKHCIYKTEGWRILEDVKPQASYEHAHVFNKYTFGLEELPDLIQKLLMDEGIWTDCTGIELIGLCTDICVVSNALLLKARFYNELDISVDATCCAGVTPESHEAALKTMEMCQINVTR